MEYKSIRQTLAMSSSTAKPKDAAEEEYQKRLNGYSTYRSGIEFEGHEMFAVAFRELLNVMDSVRGMEVQVESLWAALPPIARRAYLMELIGAEMQSTNSIEAVHTTRKEISDALDAAVADGPVPACSAAEQAPVHTDGDQPESGYRRRKRPVLQGV